MHTYRSYPTMTKISELTGHTNRVLHMAMAPDAETVVSMAADETLRFWKVASFFLAQPSCGDADFF